MTSLGESNISKESELEVKLVMCVIGRVLNRCTSSSSRMLTLTTKRLWRNISNLIWRGNRSLQPCSSSIIRGKQMIWNLEQRKNKLTELFKNSTKDHQNQFFLLKTFHSLNLWVPPKKYYLEIVEKQLENEAMNRLVSVVAFLAMVSPEAANSINPKHIYLFTVYY